MIARRASTDDLRREALREGMTSIRENARRLVLEGVTSLSEMQRITAEEQSLTEVLP